MYMCKEDLTLNNSQWLVYHEKTQTKLTPAEWNNFHNQMNRCFRFNSKLNLTVKIQF